MAKHSPEKATALLASRSMQSDSLYLLNETLEQAYRSAGKNQDADRMLKWLMENRGHAYAEYGSENFLQPVNVYSFYLAQSKTKEKDKGR